MNLEKITPRLLGLMFLIVVVLSVVGGSLFESYGVTIVGQPDDISETMTKVSDDPTKMQMGIAIFLIEAVAIVLLAVLLYSVLRTQDEIMARWALGLWIVEAVFVAVKVISAFSLIYTSQDFVRAGAPDPSYFQTLGGLFVESWQFGYYAQMVFYCVGGILFYYLFLISRYVPSVLALWGVMAASLGLVGTLALFFDYNVPMYVMLPILPFEISIGVLLLVKGIRDGSETE